MTQISREKMTYHHKTWCHKINKLDTKEFKDAYIQFIFSRKGEEETYYRVQPNYRNLIDVYFYLYYIGFIDDNVCEITLLRIAYRGESKNRNFTVCPNFNPIILCVYYSCALITFNYKEKVVTFIDWQLKRKRFWDWNSVKYKYT